MTITTTLELVGDSSSQAVDDSEIKVSDVQDSPITPDTQEHTHRTQIVNEQRTHPTTTVNERRYHPSTKMETLVVANVACEYNAATDRINTALDTLKKDLVSIEFKLFGI
jgi:hypothetical protein